MGKVIEIIPAPPKSGKNAAFLSIIAPLIAVMLNFASMTETMKYSVYRPFLASGAFIAVWAGFLFALVGLIRGIGGIVIRSILYSMFGILFNVGLVAMAFGVVPGVKGTIGSPGKVTMLQLNSIPQVFEDSITIFNPKFGFRLELPRGFVDNPDSTSAGKAINSFVRYDNEGKPNIIINIERLRRIMAPRKGKPSVDEVEKFKLAIQKTWPYAVVDKVEEEQWKTHTLDAFMLEAPDKGKMISMWIVQVPLADEAIQIQVGGPFDGQAQYLKVLRQILKSLQGVSNWDQSDAAD
ncbi:MAG: hypothetical protein JW749_04905 [Sedimentisphaerales bacterium]|nr:hypothetical protein [Sedimentisphaerales bacterium]